MAQEILFKLGVETDASTIGTLSEQLYKVNEAIKETKRQLTGLDQTWKQFHDNKMAAGERDMAQIGRLWREHKAIKKAELEANVELYSSLKAQLGSELTQRQQLSSQLSQSLKATTDKVSANTFEEGSINQLRAALSAATAQYNAMSAAKRTSAQGKELETSIISQTAAINTLEQKMGNFRRNVGNYASGWNGLANSINQVTREMPNFAQSATIGFMALSNNFPILLDELQRLRAGIKLTQAETAALALSSKEAAIASATLAGASVTEAAAAGVAAEKQVLHNAALTAQPSLMKQVMKSIFSWQSLLITGISLTVIYAKEISAWWNNVKLLTEQEKKAQESQRDLNKALFEITNAWRVYRGEISLSEAALLNLANANTMALEKLERETKEKLEDVSQWYNILWTNLKAAAINLPGITGAWLRQEEQMLIQADLVIAKSQQIQLQLQKISQDTVDELNKLTKQVDNLKTAAISDDFTREKQVALDKKKAAQLEADSKIVITKDTIENVRNLSKAYNLIEEQYQLEIQAATKKHNEKSRQEKEKKDKDALELEREYQRLLIVNKYEGFAEELKLAEKSNEWELEDLKKKGASQKLIEQKEEEHRQKLIEIKEKWFNLNAEINEKARDAEHKAETKLQEEQEKEWEKLAADFFKQWEKEEEIDQKKKEKKAKDKEKEAEKNRKLAIDASIQAARQTVDAISQIKQDALERDLKRELTAIQRNADGEDRILENRLKNGMISEGQYADEKIRLNERTAAAELEANRKAFEQKKKMDIATLTSNYILQLSAIYLNSAANPMNAVTAGAAGATQSAILAGAATAAYIAQLAVLSKTQFALGGKVNGKSHAEGGVQIEVEGDEGIINKRSMRSQQVMQAVGTPSQIASAINATGGGVSWESGASIRPNPNMFRNNSSSESISYGQMAALIQDLKQGINDKKVVLLESDVTKTQKRVSTYESASKW